MKLLCELLSEDCPVSTECCCTVSFCVCVHRLSGLSVEQFWLGTKKIIILYPGIIFGLQNYGFECFFFVCLLVLVFFSPECCKLALKGGLWELTAQGTQFVEQVCLG